MTVSVESNSTAPIMELAVAIGRIEEKVSGITKMEDRLRVVENTVERLEARQPQRVSGWTIAAAILSVPASLAALIAVILLVVNR